MMQVRSQPCVVYHIVCVIWWIRLVWVPTSSICLCHHYNCTPFISLCPYKSQNPSDFDSRRLTHYLKPWLECWATNVLSSMCCLQVALNATSTSNLAMSMMADALSVSAQEETNELLSILTQVCARMFTQVCARVFAWYRSLPVWAHEPFPLPFCGDWGSIQFLIYFFVLPLGLRAETMIATLCSHSCYSNISTVIFLLIHCLQRNYLSATTII